MANRKKKISAPEPMVSVSHMTAVLENIEQQNRGTIDAVFASSRELKEYFDGRFRAIELRLEALEFAVRQHTEEIAGLRTEVRRLANILGADRDENAIQTLERRVSALEARVAG